MKSSHLYAPFFLAAGLALLLLTAARAEDVSSTFKFTDPAKPGTLKIHVGHGDVRVSGGDAAEITVVSNSGPPERESRKDGLRVLATSSSYSFSEKDNVATLEYGTNGRGSGRATFKITVPRTTAVIISNAWGGDVACSDLTGDVEVKSLNGEVRLDNIAAGAAVETMNGAIHASISKLHEGRSICCTSMNGAITIRVPADSKANVRLRTQNGAILTDFDDKALVTKAELTAQRSHHGAQVIIKRSESSDDDDELSEDTREEIREASRQTAEAAREAARAVREAARAVHEGLAEGADVPIPPLPPLPPMTGGKIVTGTLNGGGPEIQATTMNGEVVLRKLDGK